MFLERWTKNNSGGWGLYVLFDSGNTKLKAKVNNSLCGSIQGKIRGRTVIKMMMILIRNYGSLDTVGEFYCLSKEIGC
jgi:hypothetical protein